jgi:molecular chaperone DnaJ
MAESPIDLTAGTARTEPRGADLRVDLQLTFEEAAVGCTREITVTRNEPCGACEGSAFVSGTSVVDCSECRATGWIVRQGDRSIRQRCMTCVGGKLRTACNACGGEGVHSRVSGVSITIPAGVEDGQALRLLGKGDAIRGGKPGHLDVVLAVQRHPRFTRQGGDLIVEIEIAPVPNR